MLVGSNDRIQGVISQLEDTCKTIEVGQLTPRDSEPVLIALQASGCLSDTLETPITMFRSSPIEWPPNIVVQAVITVCALPQSTPLKKLAARQSVAGYGREHCYLTRFLGGNPEQSLEMLTVFQEVL